MKSTLILLTALFITPLSFADGKPPFSEAVRVGNMLYLSGQVGLSNASGTPQLVSGGIEAETKQAMENIKKVLAKNGSSMGHVVKCTAMLADIKDWPAMNKVYASYFPNGQYPARSAFATNGLAFGAHIELECMATV